MVVLIAVVLGAIDEVSEFAKVEESKVTEELC